ncbi:hypothetical protein A7U60_g9085 [Sanghuangporus baumii]|uniref:Uncharacterized protein n=1 Tax=Sanghuangporus baumii TaxID=108892 RepID=A0A9Q5HQ85_SANBA|nr:hypothetical protein A7U60_g9085 [Sanghuangporus baumii]
MLQEQYTLHLPSGETQMYNMSDIHSDLDDGQELFNVVNTIMRDGSQMVSFPLTLQWRIASYANDMFKVAKKRKKETSSLREVILWLESDLHAGFQDQAANIDEPLRTHILKMCFGAPLGVIQEFQRNWRHARLPSGGTSSVSVTTSARTKGNVKEEEVKGLKPDAVLSWKYAIDHFLAIMRRENGNVESKDPSPNTVFDTKVFCDAASSICASLKDQLKEEEKTKVFLLHIHFAHAMLEDSVVAFEILTKSNILWEYGSEAVHSIELPLKLDEDRDAA